MGIRVPQEAMARNFSCISFVPFTRASHKALPLLTTLYYQNKSLPNFLIVRQAQSYRVPPIITNSRQDPLIVLERACFPALPPC